MRLARHIFALAAVVVLGIAPRSAHAAPFDQAFIDAMVPHHQSALMMAQMAVKKAPHREVKNMARMMIRDQQREINQLKSWRKAWYGSAEVPMDMMKGAMKTDGMNHDSMPHGSMSNMKMSGDKMRMMSGSMMGLPMKMEMNMGKLMRLNGRAFEKMFLAMMVPHHASAISMAQEALDTSGRPQIRMISHQIIDAQAKEIGAMRDLHRRWYGSL